MPLYLLNWTVRWNTTQKSWLTFGSAAHVNGAFTQTRMRGDFSLTSLFQLHVSASHLRPHHHMFGVKGFKQVREHEFQSLRFFCALEIKLWLKETNNLKINLQRRKGSVFHTDWPHSPHSVSVNRPWTYFGDQISQSAPETTQARERRICLFLCLSDPNRSFISVLLWKGTPGPEILIHRRSCSPGSLARPQTILVCDDAVVWQQEKRSVTSSLSDRNESKVKLRISAAVITKCRSVSPFERYWSCEM